jgi:aryl-phospho-beta-D-glucosidase BglC (GH1 family)
MKPNLLRGFNLGGWLSQSSLSDQHSKTFITEHDFQQIAHWGFNSIRLPIDSQWIFENQGTGPISPVRLDQLCEYLSWAQKANLIVVLDLHEVPWHSFAQPNMQTLFNHEVNMKQFCRLWTELAAKLRFWKGEMWFDILNEPTAEQSSDWGRVALQAVQAIRSEDSERPIVIESTLWGSVFKLEDVVNQVQGDRLIYSFHFYEPMWVTHQRAPWWNEGVGYQEIVHYPGYLPRVQEYLNQPGLTSQAKNRLSFEGSCEWNAKSLRIYFEAVEKLQKQGYPLYCGEFGVYEGAPRSTRLFWTKDVIQIFQDLQIGWSYWTYKWMDFGVVAKQAQGTQDGFLDQEILQVLRG